MQKLEQANDLIRRALRHFDVPESLASANLVYEMTEFLRSDRTILDRVEAEARAAIALPIGKEPIGLIELIRQINNREPHLLGRQLAIYQAATAWVQEINNLTGGLMGSSRRRRKLAELLGMKS